MEADESALAAGKGEGIERALRERGLSANPALPLLRPRKRDAGLRKSELARVQFRHYDGRNLTVFGKGQKVRYLLIVDQELRTGARAAHA